MKFESTEIISNATLIRFINKELPEQEQLRIEVLIQKDRLLEFRYQNIREASQIPGFDLQRYLARVKKIAKTKLFNSLNNQAFAKLRTRVLIDKENVDNSSNSSSRRNSFSISFPSPHKRSIWDHPFHQVIKNVFIRFSEQDIKYLEFGFSLYFKTNGIHSFIQFVQTTEYAEYTLFFKELLESIELAIVLEKDFIDGKLLLFKLKSLGYTSLNQQMVIHLVNIIYGKLHRKYFQKIIKENHEE